MRTKVTTAQMTMGHDDNNGDMAHPWPQCYHNDDGPPHNGHPALLQQQTMKADDTTQPPTTTLSTNAMTIAMTATPQ